jgi:hypothetical protein
MTTKKDLTKVDFAKRDTDFSAEFERQRALLFLELQRTVRCNGWFSRLIHAIAKKPFLTWN